MRLGKEELTSFIKYLEVLKGAVHARVRRVLHDMEPFVEEDVIMKAEYFVHGNKELDTPIALTFHAQCTEEGRQIVQELLEEHMMALEKEMQVLCKY